MRARKKKRVKVEREVQVLHNRICPECGGALVPINPLDPSTKWLCVSCVKKQLTLRAEQGHCKIKGGACAECG